MTNSGFYSIVEKEWDKAAGTLTVRARRLEDLQSFLEAAARHITAPSLAKAFVPARADRVVDPALTPYVEHDDGADYAYRARVAGHVVAATLGALVAGINYDNFKNSVYDAGLKDHATAYAGVWSVMMRLQTGGRYNRERGGMTGDLFAITEPAESVEDGTTLGLAERDYHYDCPECGGSGEVESRNGIDPPEWIDCRACNTPPHIEAPDHEDNDMR